MQSFVSDVPRPPEHLLPQNVHIIMDRTTGKTFNYAFIELAVTPEQAKVVVQARNQKVLKGRLVTVGLSSQDELMRSVFPKWPGEFVNGEPVTRDKQAKDGDKEAPKGGSLCQTVASISDLSLCLKPSTHSTPFIRAIDAAHPGGSVITSSSAPSIPAFVTRGEINTLLAVCRNYKVQEVPRPDCTTNNEVLTCLSLHSNAIASLFSKVCREAIREHYLNHCEIPMASTSSRATNSQGSHL